MFGRGSVDDGYGGYAGILSVLALQDQGVAHPTCRFLIETGEESGSPDLSLYLDELEAVLGVPDLVVVLDTGGIDYDRLWITESLRGIVAGTLSVKVSSIFFILIIYNIRIYHLTSFLSPFSPPILQVQPFFNQEILFLSYQYP